MEFRKLFSALLLIGLLVNVSCSKDSETPIGGKEDVTPRTESLTVTIAGTEGYEIGKPNVETRALGTPTLTEENKIFGYSIYVFYANGSLEKVETVSGGTLTKTVTGLIAGAKKVVVLANIPTGYSTITHYDDFDGAMFSLDTQEPSNLATTGLAMSGEKTATLVAGSTNTVSIPVARIAAKIKLGGITINAAPGHDPSKFELVAVHIMKAQGGANKGLPTLKTSNVYYGGTAGTISTTTKSYLTESISTGNENCYFYVFPNDDADTHVTLFTIEGKYDGVTTYFAFRINDEVDTPGDGTGEFIKRNTVHTINVTLKKLDGGTSDPELPADPTDMDVTIVPQDWTVIPNQNVEW